MNSIPLSLLSLLIYIAVHMTDGVYSSASDALATPLSDLPPATPLSDLPPATPLSDLPPATPLSDLSKHTVAAPVVTVPLSSKTIPVPVTSEILPVNTPKPSSDIDIPRGAATKTPPAMPSNGSSSGPTNGNSYPHLKPSDIFTVTLNNETNADTFKNNLARYMDISTSCVELLAPVNHRNDLPFRFTDCGPNASDPKVLEAKLNKLWSNNAAEVMREIGISRMQVPVTDNTPDRKKELYRILIFVAAGIGALILLGVVVGFIIYKKRSAKSSDFVVENDQANYISMETFKYLS